MTGHKITEKHLSDALEKGEFLFHYQPILSLRSGRINAAEALIRWKKDNGDIIPPGKFIPYAEETGFITEITKAMIPRFLKDQKKILQADSTIVSSFNISSKDLMQDSFISTFLTLADDIGIDTNKIKIELTESAALSLTSKDLLQIAKLIAADIGFSVDDFGTGYATFEKLKNLPFSTLKIDYSITSAAMATPDGLTLLDHSVNLAHQLKLDCVAEGVEDEDTMRYLMGVGCDHIQGFYISKPLEHSSFVEFLNKKPVWGNVKIGYIYKAMIDHIDWVRKATSTLYMSSKQVRILPYESIDSPVGLFLADVVDKIDIKLYDDLHALHKECYELAKIMLNARSSNDQSTVDNLIPEFFKLSSAINKLLHEAYSREFQQGLLNKTTFRE